jgi:hypothetical protein
MIFKSPALPDLASEVSVSLQGASQIARPLGRSRIGFYRLFNDAALFHCHSACIYKTRTRKFLDFTASLMRGIPGYVTRIAVARILANHPQAARSVSSTHADVES